MVVVIFVLPRPGNEGESGGGDFTAGSDDGTLLAHPMLRFRVREKAATASADAPCQTTGLHAWPSSLLLGAHVVEMGLRGGLRGFRVVELGAGTGIAGLCAALSSPCHRVTLTDGDPKVVQNLQRTVADLKDSLLVCPHICDRDGATPTGAASQTSKSNEANGSEAGDRNDGNDGLLMKVVRVQELEWGATRPEDLQGYDADIILGADCLYERASWDDFLATVYGLLVCASKKGEGHAHQPRFLGCHQLRNSSHTLAPYLAHWGLQARALPMPGIVGRTESGGIVSSHFDDTLGLFELTLSA
jgi:predicted nicotinamide N-methyase